MPAVIPAPIISSIDSYYAFVVKQMAQVNSSRVASMLGMAESQDWPQLEIVDGGIYLLHVGSTPMQSRQSTEMFTLFEHAVQWVWILLGSDIQAADQAANRGDRYRSSLAIFEDLHHASYPGFCCKGEVTVDAQGNVSMPITNPLEMVRWTGLRLRKTQKIESGALYGVVATEIIGYEQMTPAVDAALAMPPLPM